MPKWWFVSVRLLLMLLFQWLWIGTEMASLLQAILYLWSVNDAIFQFLSRCRLGCYFKMINPLSAQVMITWNVLFYSLCLYAWMTWRVQDRSPITTSGLAKRGILHNMSSAGEHSSSLRSLLFSPRFCCRAHLPSHNFFTQQDEVIDDRKILGLRRICLSSVKAQFWKVLLKNLCFVLKSKEHTLLLNILKDQVYFLLFEDSVSIYLYPSMCR